MFKELTLGQQTIDNITKKVFVEKRLVSFLFVGFFNLNQVLGFKLRRREAKKELFSLERSSVISICFLLDVDECSIEQIPADYIHLENNCHDDATCFNTKGSFYCTCHTGYSGHGVTCIGNDLSLTCSYC